MGWTVRTEPYEPVAVAVRLLSLSVMPSYLSVLDQELGCCWWQGEKAGWLTIDDFRILSKGSNFRQPSTSECKSSSGSYISRRVSLTHCSSLWAESTQLQKCWNTLHKNFFSPVTSFPNGYLNVMRKMAINPKPKTSAGCPKRGFVPWISGAIHRSDPMFVMFPWVAVRCLEIPRSVMATWHSCLRIYWFSTLLKLSPKFTENTGMWF